MKISLLLHASTILLAITFVSGEETNSNLRSTPSEEERELESVEDVLGRDECLPLAKTQLAIMKEIVLKNSDNSIAAYHCNPIQRKQTRKTLKVFEKLLEQDGIEPCAAAGFKLILNKKEDVKKGTKSTANCKAQIKKEIIDFKEVIKQEKAGRMLLGGAAISNIVGVACKAAGTIATGIASTLTAGVKILGKVVSSTVGAVGKKSRRRQLDKIESALDFEDTEDPFELCKDEMYSLFMYVESDGSHTLGHINMVAKPLDSNNEDCQEALVFDDYDAGERLISFVDDLHFDYDWQTDALSLGNFVLGDMKAAADLATVVQPNRYDIMTNNCATFVIEMLGHLKIPINTEVKHYTVNSLVKSPGLVEAIGGSASAESSANKEMMWNFVSNYIEEHRLL